MNKLEDEEFDFAEYERNMSFPSSYSRAWSFSGIEVIS